MRLFPCETMWLCTLYRVEYSLEKCHLEYSPRQTSFIPGTVSTHKPAPRRGQQSFHVQYGNTAGKEHGKYSCNSPFSPDHLCHFRERTGNRKQASTTKQKRGEVYLPTQFFHSFGHLSRPTNLFTHTSQGTSKKAEGTIPPCVAERFIIVFIYPS